MCIAFDGAYIREAPTADPGITDEHRPVPETTPAGGGGSCRAESLRPASPPAVMPDPVREVSASLK